MVPGLAAANLRECVCPCRVDGATKDAYLHLRKRLVQTDDDRAHAFDGHVQLMLFVF